MTELVDYAGLFPPAALPMRDVVTNYAAYRASADAWMLGRLVVPASRLAECAPCRIDNVPWRVTALIADMRTDPPLLHAHDTLVVDAVELKAQSPDDVARAAATFGDGVAVYVEIPVAADPALLLDAIATHGLRAKIRTGGVTPDAFPAAQHVARFIAACGQRRLPFKATAGLHHPIRASYRLTYAADAPHGTMYGFLNVFLAAIAAQAGECTDLLEELLEEDEPTSITFSDEAIAWRSHAWPFARVQDARAHFAMAFGSCSFREPVDDLAQLGFL